MSFANTYFKRFQSKEPLITENPKTDLFLSIVIPAFNEPDLCRSLQSIKDCDLPKKSVEVIVIINSAEHTSDKIKEINIKSYEEAVKFAKQNNTSKIQFLIIKIEDLPSKFAGVGLARKIGMDEALHRFNSLDKPAGLIAGFDADSLVEKNYLTEIEDLFERFPKTNACSVNFEHPIEGSDFDDDIYKNIINYELHLRYFNEALKFANFPYAYHTIGSAFIVRADIYAQEGGMNRKKAGEDFYFLQKIITRGNYNEINTTRVIPSPRVSDRVPFGTGAAVKKMINHNVNEYFTYKLEVFIILKEFFENVGFFYTKYSEKNVNEIILDFLKLNKFEEDLKKIRKNSPNKDVFNKRFFDWFNAFRVIKFVNYVHGKYYEKDKVLSESIKLLQLIRPNIQIPKTEKDLLICFRNIQKQLI